MGLDYSNDPRIINPSAGVASSALAVGKTKGGPQAFGRKVATSEMSFADRMNSMGAGMKEGLSNPKKWWDDWVNPEGEDPRLHTSVWSKLTGSKANLEGELARVDSANARSEAAAQKQMDFQERMRATQYQTSVEDMKAAGLNPQLAVMSGAMGGGAGVPSGARYQAQSGQQQKGDAPIGAIAALVGIVASSALAAGAKIKTSKMKIPKHRQNGLKPYYDNYDDKWIYR